MKKLIATGLFAVCLIAFSEQQASAWVNSKFGIGLNLDWQSGGNSFLWGLWRNGQVPGPAGGPGFGGPGFGGPGYGGPGFGGPGYGPGFGPGGPGFGPGFAPGFGGGQPFAPNVLPGQTPAPPLMNGAMLDAQYMAPYAGMNAYGSPFQFANYTRPVYYYPNGWYGR